MLLVKDFLARTYCVASPDWLATRAGVCVLLCGGLSSAIGVLNPSCDWLSRAGVCDLELGLGVVGVSSVTATCCFSPSCLRTLYAFLTL